jgi:hypothetical protein
MPELSTVEIRSTKDESQKWIINESDYNPDIHTLWVSDDDSVMVSEEPQDESVDDDHSDEDFIEDKDGNQFVNIINPSNRRSRLQISLDEYDPEKHEVWSSHPRFNK